MGDRSPRNWRAALTDQERAIVDAAEAEIARLEERIRELRARSSPIQNRATQRAAARPKPIMQDCWGEPPIEPPKG